MVAELRSSFREGLGESAASYRSHPLVNFTYFAFILGLTMFSNHPAFLLSSFLMSWAYSLLLRGKKALRFNCLVLLPAIVLTVLLNTLNVHNGVTVLFYLNGNRITLEAIVFGFVEALVLSSVIIWFSCFNTVVTADKFIYLFGRIFPVLALTLSMIMRFIPLLQNRFRQISMAQRCMGRGSRDMGLMARLRQFAKEISILIAWSLEAAIDSADSMEARGYGLPGRTSFHLFRLSGGERWLLALLLLLGGICTAACIGGVTNIYYYPTILLPPLSWVQAVSLLAFWLLMLSVAVLDLRGVSQWN